MKKAAKLAASEWVSGLRPITEPGPAMLSLLRLLRMLRIRQHQ